jgi:hypothetical protein
MARPSTALRRFAVVSATGALAGLAALAAAGTASAATVPQQTAAQAAADVPGAPMQGPCPYVVIVHHEGLLTSLLDGLL